MKILLFGVSGVGKKDVGACLADMLSCPFYDLEEEVMRLKMPQEEFMLHYRRRRTRDQKRKDVLFHLLDTHDDCVIAVTPIFYRSVFRHIISRPDIFPVVLKDTPEAIYEKIDHWNGFVYEDNEYKRPHTRHTLEDIKNDILVYDELFSQIKYTMHIHGRSVDSVAQDIVKLAALIGV